MPARKAIARAKALCRCRRQAADGLVKRLVSTNLAAATLASRSHTKRRPRQSRRARLHTEAQFFAWLEGQRDGRYELVDGQPSAMRGTTQRHDLITTNLIMLLRNRLRGGPCRTGTSDIAIRIPNRNIRYPDVAVDCGRFEETERAAIAPTLVAEVLSRSIMGFDQTEKLEEYRTVETLRHILIIDPDQPPLRLHTRLEDGHWSSAPHEGLGTIVALSALAIALPLAELYEGLSFRPIPRLIPPPQADGLG